MARNPKKRQKALQRKKDRRKQKKSRFKQFFQPGARRLLRQAPTWPLHEVLLTEEWDKEGAIIQIMVARRSAQDRLAVGMFLVDLGCLGVKNAFARVLESWSEYQDLRREITAHQPLISADLNLAAKIVEEGVAYARQLGFKPNPDYPQAKRMLGEADPGACSVHIPLGGSEGKPFFVAGPYDNADRIMAKLTKAVGPDGFHFMMPVDPGSEVFMDDESWEEEHPT
jgi:hypothetical protein